MGILELLIAIVLIMWLGGFALNVAGGIIHLLLILAVVLFVARMFRSTV